MTSPQPRGSHAPAPAPEPLPAHPPARDALSSANDRHAHSYSSGSESPPLIYHCSAAETLGVGLAVDANATETAKDRLAHSFSSESESQSPVLHMSASNTNETAKAKGRIRLGTAQAAGTSTRQRAAAAINAAHAEDSEIAAGEGRHAHNGDTGDSPSGRQEDAEIHTGLNSTSSPSPRQEELRGQLRELQEALQQERKDRMMAELAACELREELMGHKQLLGKAAHQRSLSPDFWAGGGGGAGGRGEAPSAGGLHNLSFNESIRPEWTDRDDKRQASGAQGGGVGEEVASEHLSALINSLGESEPLALEDVVQEIAEMVVFVEGQLQLSNTVKRPGFVPPLWQTSDADRIAPEQQRAQLDRLWRVLRLMVSVVPSASECPLVLEIYRHQALASPAVVPMSSMDNVDESREAAAGLDSARELELDALDKITMLERRVADAAHGVTHAGLAKRDAGSYSATSSMSNLATYSPLPDAEDEAVEREIFELDERLVDLASRGGGGNGSSGWEIAREMDRKSVAEGSLGGDGQDRIPAWADDPLMSFELSNESPTSLACFREGSAKDANSETGESLPHGANTNSAYSAQTPSLPPGRGAVRFSLSNTPTLAPLPDSPPLAATPSLEDALHLFVKGPDPPPALRGCLVSTTPERAKLREMELDTPVRSVVFACARLCVCAYVRMYHGML